MTSADWIGASGVTLLLVAFFANVVGWLDREARTYAALNIVGAGLAGWASWMIGFIPFVVLEATWCGVGLVALVRPNRRAAD